MLYCKPSPGMAQIHHKFLCGHSGPVILSPPVFGTIRDHSQPCSWYLNRFIIYIGNKFSSLPSGNQVKAVVDTQYPFSDSLTTTITATKAFTYYVRIPSWVVGGTIALNSGPAKAVSPVNGLQAVAARAGTTKFVLELPAPITIGASDKFSIYHNDGF